MAESIRGISVASSPMASSVLPDDVLLVMIPFLYGRSISIMVTEDVLMYFVLMNEIFVSYLVNCKFDGWQNRE